MQVLFKTLLGTLGIVALIVHDILSFCQLIGKEKWIETFCRKHLPKFKYNEDLVFNSIKMLFFSIFLFGHIGTGFLLNTLLPVQVLWILAVVLALGITMKLGYKIRKEEKKLKETRDEIKKDKNEVGDEEQA